MNIGEFSKISSLTTDTIRFYEKKGFFSHKRQLNGYRVYNDKDIEVAELIIVGKTMGFSLEEILNFAKEMSSSSINHQKIQEKLQLKIELIDQQINLLEKTKKLIKEKIRYCKSVEAKEKLCRPKKKPLL